MADGQDGSSASIRLLVLNYEYPPLGGGASPITAALCRHFVKLGARVDVVTMGFRGLPKREEREAGGLRIFRVRCLRLARHICRIHELFTYVVSGLFSAWRLARRERYDLVHAHFVFPSGVVAYALKKLTGLPYVITAHGSDVAGYNPDRFRTAHRILAPAWRVIVRNAEAITSPSESLAELIRNNYRRPLDVEIVPNAIEADWIRPGGKGRTILVVSRLFERKGVQHLLEALRDGPGDWQVEVVGDGPHRGELERLAASLQVPVQFHGWLENRSPELIELYRRASIFVFPSVAENFPVCLLEAMLAGAAIVATDLAACQEVLGDEALYVPPRSPSAIAAKLERLTKDEALRQLLGQAARRRALDRFTWDRVARRYLDLFSYLVRKRRVADAAKTAEAQGRAPRVLIMPGDVRNNLGDTAICLATVRLMRDHRPDALVEVWGRPPKLAAGFEGVRFVSGFNPAALTALAGARTVVWGGGQLMQGNRSRVKVAFWAARILLLRALGARIIGFGQGVGPLASGLDRALARLAASGTDAFTVRDPSSRRELLASGLDPEKVRLAADPALLLAAGPDARSGPEARKDGVASEEGPIVGLSFRYTGHHRQGRLIPFKFLPAGVRRAAFRSAGFEHFEANLAAFCERLVAELGARLVFIPMYYAPWESDVLIAERLAARPTLERNTEIFRPKEGVDELLEAMSGLDAFVGVPMHSTILATAARVPTLALPYEPKGSEYMRMLGLERWSLPVEAVEEPGGEATLHRRFMLLWARRREVTNELAAAVPTMRERASMNAETLADLLGPRPVSAVERTDVVRTA